MLGQGREGQGQTQDRIDRIGHFILPNTVVRGPGVHRSIHAKVPSTVVRGPGVHRNIHAKVPNTVVRSLGVLRSIHAKVLLDLGHGPADRMADPRGVRIIAGRDHRALLGTRSLTMTKGSPRDLDLLQLLDLCLLLVDP